MLTATRAGAFARRYDITVDGNQVATWSQAFWRNGGDITVAGHTYRVEGAAFRNRYRMVDPLGAEVATAEKAGRKHWTVFADGKPHRFRRASLFGNRQELLIGDQPVGSIRKTGFWGTKVEADLPTLSLPAQVFAVGVMITTWDRQAAAAAGASGGGG
jgi:hypothetical protein